MVEALCQTDSHLAPNFQPYPFQNLQARLTIYKAASSTDRSLIQNPREGTGPSCGSFFFFLYLTPGGTDVPSLPRGMGINRIIPFPTYYCAITHDVSVSHALFRYW